MTIVHATNLDDTAAREWVRDTLAHTRQQQGITLQSLRIPLGAGVRKIEHRTTWRLSLVQRWASALGLAFTTRLDGVPDYDGDGDELAAMYAATSPDSVEAQWRLDRRILVNDLARARRAAGLSGPQLGARLGLHRSAVLQWESAGDDSLLPTFQVRARALGGRLLLGLEWSV